MSGKPIDEAALTTVRFLDGGVVQMDRADYDRLTAAQQQGQAQGGGEVGRIGGEPKRIQQFGEPVYYLYTMLVEDVPNPLLTPGTKLYTAPPSAPVGLEVRGVADTLIAAANNPVSSGGERGLRDLMKAQASRLHALAQQTAAVALTRKYPDDGNGDDDAYNRGWNECLDALATQHQEPKT